MCDHANLTAPIPQNIPMTKIQNLILRPFLSPWSLKVMRIRYDTQSWERDWIVTVSNFQNIKIKKNPRSIWNKVVCVKVRHIAVYCNLRCLMNVFVWKTPHNQEGVPQVRLSKLLGIKYVSSTCVEKRFFKKNCLFLPERASDRPNFAPSKDTNQGLFQNINSGPEINILPPSDIMSDVVAVYTGHHTNLADIRVRF